MGTSNRCMELQRQKEIIQLWLDTTGIPADVHEQLLEMLIDVNKEISALLLSTSCHAEVV